MFENRQACRRIAANIAVLYESSGMLVRSFLHNLSSGGMFIKTDEPLPVDTVLSLRFRLPGDIDPMDIPGRVVWIKQIASASPAGMGIQFSGILPAYRQRIQAFVESQV